jgi:hypothetical protein
MVVNRNRDLLWRIVGSLFAMARIVEGGAAVMLPRNVYRAVMLILRPAESAVRRLIVIAARGLVLKLRPPRPVPAGVMSFSSASAARMPAFALIDPLKQFGPDVWTQADNPALLLRRADSFDPAIAWQHAQLAETPVNAALLFNRLRAMRLALNDLPRQARRLARWRARRDLALASKGPFRPRRMSPFRPGLPPGYRRKDIHQVDAVLKDLHYFARQAGLPDTS